MEVKDFPNYLIYDDGRVQNKKTKRFLKQSIQKNGYYTISLCKDNKSKTFLIHRLIALHYIPLIILLNQFYILWNVDERTNNTEY